jgi:hypothetical protein
LELSVLFKGLLVQIHAELNDGGHAEHGGTVSGKAVSRRRVSGDGKYFAFDTDVDKSLRRKRSSAPSTAHEARRHWLRIM